MRLMLLALFVLLLGVHTVHASENSAIKVVGWVEKVRLELLNESIAAKLDTGAKTTSIDAEVMEIKKPENKDAKERVIFRIKGEKGNILTLEREIVRWVHIKKRNSEKFMRRPVIMMHLCVAGRAVYEEVNLAERDAFNYSILVGRNMLEHAQLAVDASRTFSSRPNCPKPQQIAKDK